MIFRKLYQKNLSVPETLCVCRYFEILLRAHWRLRKRFTRLENGDWNLDLMLGPVFVSFGVDSWFSVNLPHSR